jgi:hypothetical protein
VTSSDIVSLRARLISTSTHGEKLPDIIKRKAKVAGVTDKPQFRHCGCRVAPLIAFRA